MKATELRVGNWITNNRTEYKATALSVFCAGINHQPITLTEEWLVKLGFEDEYVEHVGTCYSIECGLRVLSIHSESLISLDVYGVELKHVHQLQNLYFALTGEELTIK